MGRTSQRIAKAEQDDTIYANDIVEVNTLGELKAKVDHYIEKRGPETAIKFDLGHNSISVELTLESVFRRQVLEKVKSSLDDREWNALRDEILRVCS